MNAPARSTTHQPKAQRPKSQRRKASAKPQPNSPRKRRPKDPPRRIKQMSQLAAAIRVLSQSQGAMSCVAIVEAMTTAGYWKSPGGATPAATLYASILREIQAQGDNSRFRKVGRGLFELTAKGKEASQ